MFICSLQPEFVQLFYIGLYVYILLEYFVVYLQVHFAFNKYIKNQASYRVYRNPFFFFQFFVLFLCRYSPFQIFHLLHEYDYAILSDRLRKKPSDQFQVRLSSMMSYFTYEICQFMSSLNYKHQSNEMLLKTPLIIYNFSFAVLRIIFLKDVTRMLYRLDRCR